MVTGRDIVIHCMSSVVICELLLKLIFLWHVKSDFDETWNDVRAACYKVTEQILDICINDASYIKGAQKIQYNYFNRVVLLNTFV